jgi:mannose-6-phosphate isomerase-like protein (cupin superfamily)
MKELFPAVPVRKIAKPWGFELIWAESEHYVGKILHIRAGEALSYQFHKQKDETVFLLSGALEFEWAADAGSPPARVQLRPGQSVRIRPGMCHRLTAVVESEVLEVSTPHLDDVVRLVDRYGREDS